MKGYLISRLRWLTFTSGMLLMTLPAFPQVINAGLKAGFNYSWTGSDDADFRREYNTKPVPGFNAGAVFSFQLKERYFLHSEILYSTKGRIVEGDMGLWDHNKYQYIEIPLMYQIHFKGRLGSKGTKQFKWYAGIGPNFSYWLGGNGAVSHFEMADHDVDVIGYELRFGERPPEETGESSLVYIEGARRIQVGVNFGGGIVVEPGNHRKIMVDLRFELGHSWLGDHADYVFPTMYSGNLQTRNLGVRLSAMYLLQTNTDKKVRNKGKSGVKKKGKMLQRR